MKILSMSFYQQNAIDEVVIGIATANNKASKSSLLPMVLRFEKAYCPDICPNTLTEITTWIEALGDDANSLKVIFITVDPERDDVKTVAEYLSNFSPKIVGWIGNTKQLADASEFLGLHISALNQMMALTRLITLQVFFFSALMGHLHVQLIITSPENWPFRGLYKPFQRNEPLG